MHLKITLTMNMKVGRFVGGPQVEGSKGTPVLILGAALRVCTCVLVCLCVLVLLSDGGLRSKTTCQLQVPPGYYQGCFSDRSGHPTENTAWTIVVEYYCTDHIERDGTCIV